MAWPTGTPRGEKTGGRKKGVPNKRTLQLTEALENLNFDVIERLAVLMPELTYEKQVDVCLGLMPYLYPKRKPISPNPDEQHPMTIAEFMAMASQDLEQDNDE